MSARCSSRTLIRPSFVPLPSLAAPAAGAPIRYDLAGVIAQIMGATEEEPEARFSGGFVFDDAAPAILTRPATDGERFERTFVYGSLGATGQTDPSRPGPDEPGLDTLLYPGTIDTLPATPAPEPAWAARRGAA